MSSLLQLRARKAAVREVTNQLMALTEPYRVAIAFEARSPAIIHANHATGRHRE